MVLTIRGKSVEYKFYASMVKLVDTGDLKSPAARCAGSSPARGTKLGDVGELV